MKRLILTYNQSCNLSCDFCYVSFHHEKVIDRTIDIVNRLKELGFTIITFGGGDAFSKRMFREGCIIANKNGIKTHVDTNCISIKENDYEFITKYVDLLGISIDGLGECHDKMRNKKDLFTKVNATLIKLQELNYSVKVNTMVSKCNIHTLCEIAEYLQKFNNINIWSLYQFFPLDAAKKSEVKHMISDEDFDTATEKIEFQNVSVEKFKYSNRVNGYIFTDETGRIYTNSINGEYKNIGSIFDNEIEKKLSSLDINPLVKYRYS